MRISWLFGVMAVALVASCASAAITGITFVADTDGAIVVPQSQAPQWSGSSGSEVVSGVQHAWPAQLVGQVTASDDLDPTINSVQNVLNDTGFTWTAYTLNLYMNKPFTLDLATGPANWSLTAIPASSGSFLDSDGNVWTDMATVNYHSNGPAYNIHNGDSGQFGVTFSFAGSSFYTIELIPVAPEPVSLMLLAVGGLLLARKRV